MGKEHTEEAVRAILAAAISKAGSARAWGRQHCISGAYAIEVRDDIKPAGARIPAALGLQRRIEIVSAEEPRS